MPNPEFIYQPPLEPWLDIYYQDDALVVVNKPSGLLSVPGRLPEHQDALSARLQQRFPECRVVHRLDMATSGLMVFALHPESHRVLSSQFERRQVNKRYICCVAGRPPLDKGSLRSPLICDWPERPKQKICWTTGKTATTHFEVLQKEKEYTFLSLYPVTGRSHQLRVHMKHLGHPILGDRLYASPDIIAASARLCLHAQALSIRHPNTQEWLHFSSEVPFHRTLPIVPLWQDPILDFSKSVRVSIPL